MLVVFDAFVVAAPLKAVVEEEAAAEIIALDFIGEWAIAVYIIYSRGRGYICAVGIDLDIWVVERIYIYSHTSAMSREARAIGCVAIVKGRRIIVVHRCLIISIILIYKHHTLNRVAILI